MWLSCLGSMFVLFRIILNRGRVYITTNDVSSNPTRSEVYSIQHYVIKFVSDLQQVGFFSDTPVSSTNKTDRHDIAEILMKVALRTISPSYQYT